MARLGLLMFVLLVLAALPLTQSKAATEYYLRVIIKDREDISRLTRVIDIDGVSDTVMLAFANEQQLARFQALGYSYTFLPLPNTQTVPEMAASVKDAQVWDSYPTYTDYVTMMNNFATNYPNLCQIQNIGTTVQGRQMLIARISDNVATEEAEPEVLYTSSMHGDETTGYVLMLRMIDSLLTGYGVNPDITNMVDNMEIWINPLANPDGTYRTGNSSVSGATRYNANNIDLNRNFPDPHAGAHPDGNSYQPETVAMMNLAVAQNFVIAANFHGGAEVVNYPWDAIQERHADDIWYQSICRQYAESCQTHAPAGYMNDLNDGITHGWDWYEVLGGRQDYMNYWHGAKEITIELSNVKLLSGSQLPNHWNYNRISLFQFLRQAQIGINGIVTDSISGNPLEALVTVLSYDNDSSDVRTDPDLGDYYRMLPAGTYNLRFSAPGYIPDTVWGIVVPNGGAVTVNKLLKPVPGNALLGYLGQSAKPILPGDTFVLRIAARNSGGTSAMAAACSLYTADAQVITTTTPFPTISANGAVNRTTIDHVIALPPSFAQSDLTLTGILTTLGADPVEETFTIPVGRAFDGFESGTFTNNTWQMSGNSSWIIDGGYVNSGMYSARSGPVGNNQSSSMSLPLTNLDSGTVSFVLRTSSQPTNDRLRFFIDGVEKGVWSGNTGWKEVSFPVTAGNHTFMWTYVKNGSTALALDRVWVDKIVFPPFSADGDGDGVPTASDNCPLVANPLQEDPDTDGVGSACDNCPNVANPLQEDTNENGVGNACEFICGDCNGNGAGPTIADLTFLVSYLFNGGPTPPNLNAANVNGLGGITIADLTYLVGYLFNSGPALACP